MRRGEVRQGEAGGPGLTLDLEVGGQQPDVGHGYVARVTIVKLHHYRV